MPGDLDIYIECKHSASARIGYEHALALGGWLSLIIVILFIAALTSIIYCDLKAVIKRRIKMTIPQNTSGCGQVVVNMGEIDVKKESNLKTLGPKEF